MQGPFYFFWKQFFYPAKPGSYRFLDRKTKANICDRKITFYAGAGFLL